MKILKKLSVILLLIATLFGYSGCGKNKNAISADEFCSKLEEKEFNLFDSTLQYSDDENINESYIAISKDSPYRIEFIVLNSDASASKMFETNKKTFEEEKRESNNAVYTSTSWANYSKYTLTVNGKYKVISRIDNTLIYVNVDSEYTDEIKSILDEIGY